MNKYIFITFVFVAILSSLCCDTEQTRPELNYSTVPTLDTFHYIIEDTDTLKPLRLQLYNDTLYIIYSGIPRIDLFDLELNKLNSIPLTDLDTVFPTSFDIYDSTVLITEHNKHRIILYDRDGKVKTSFGTLPDSMTSLSPFNIIQYGGVAYVSELRTGSVMAISIVDAGEITEIGELILTIPSDTTYRIGFPSALKITPDGRLLVGDALDGEINVFTCDGQYIYNYDSIPHIKNIEPQAFAYDNIIDPDLLKLDSNSFDPSGIRYIGRTHVADPKNALIHMFNPNGKYINSYPTDSSLNKPGGLVIDKKSNRIYIADPALQKLFVYKYQRNFSTK